MPFDLEKFFFDTPIYTKINVDEDDIDKMPFKALFFVTSGFNIEGYNPRRKVSSTFKISETLGFHIEIDGISRVTISCKRYHDEFIFYIDWNPEKRIIMKIGQYPTVADFHLGEVKQYRKVIPEEKLYTTR